MRFGLNAILKIALLTGVLLLAACSSSAVNYIADPTAVGASALDAAPTPTIVVVTPTIETPTVEVTVINPVRDDLSGTLWQLRSIGSEAVSAQITLQIVGNQISGLGGCNTYFATYQGMDDALMVDEIGRTELYCEQTMEEENAYLAALGTSRVATRDGGVMTVSTARGDLVFKPVGVVAMENEMAATAEAEVAAATQEVAAVTAEAATAEAAVAVDAAGESASEEAAVVEEGSEPTQAETPMLSGTFFIKQVRQGDMVRRVVDGATPSQVTFVEDGTLSGNAGCNNFNATYAYDGQAMTVGPIASTRMACTPALSAQEQMVFEALQTAQIMRQEGRDWVIEHASGTLLLSSIEVVEVVETPAPVEGNDGDTAASTPVATVVPTDTPSAEPERTLPIVTGFDINILNATTSLIGVNGQFADGCSRIVDTEQTVNGNIITFNVFAERDPELQCIQQVIPFRETFEFDFEGLAPGTYTVIVNGAQGLFVLNDLGN